MKKISDSELKKRLAKLDFEHDEPEHGDETEEIISRVRDGIDKEHLANYINRILVRLCGIFTNTALRVGDILGRTTTVQFKECESVVERAIMIREALPRNMFKTQAEFNRSCYRVGVEEALRLTHGFFPVKFDQFEEMSEAHNMIFRVFQDEARKRLEKACDDISEKCKDNKRNYEQIEKAKNILLKIKEPEIDWNIIEEEPIKLSSYDEVKKVG